MQELRRVLKDGGIAIVSYRNRYNELLLGPPKLIGSLLQKPINWLRRKERAAPGIGSALQPASVRGSAKGNGLRLLHQEPIGFGALRLNGKVLSGGRLAHRFNRLPHGAVRRGPLAAAQR